MTTVIIMIPIQNYVILNDAKRLSTHMALCKERVKVPRWGRGWGGGDRETYEGDVGSRR